SSRVNIIVVVPPGANPATYEPSPSDMRNISQTDVWFTIGVGFERAWIPRFAGSNPDMTIINTVRDIDRLPIDRYSIPEEIASSNTHGDNEHDHTDGWEDPHVWLSPELVRKQVAAIAECLSYLDPETETRYRANAENFILEIDSLQNSIHAMLDPMRGSCFMVFHPAWGYFADEFNLVQIPVEESGNDPSPGEMSRLVDFAKDQNVQAIFVSPQFSTSSAEAIASEVNARIIYIDPLAENWNANLIHVAEELAGTMDTR
ncbi:MAG: zinc ABC transporter substrate-binding protein, partial [Candidatus Aegiribacteria sp.]|nr:zinc ABC transporter substrate-binding protein [Candidatus Aegiribacteria sp.]